MTHILAVTNQSLNHLSALTKEDGGVFLDCNVGSVIHQEDLWIGPRPALEKDPNYRQLIPYAVIKNNDGKILVYKRTTNGNEERLHEKHSIGFGGHIDLNDIRVDQDGQIDVLQTIADGCKRELGEELGDGIVDHVFSIRNLKGILIDNSTEVERVHIGAVSFFGYYHDQIMMAAEDHLEVIGFLSAEEIATLPNLESWSKVIIEWLQQHPEVLNG